MMRTRVLLAMFIASQLALAVAADVPPQPGGVYPLARGVYVAQGTDCATPANAAIRVYDGQGISTAHTHACVATVLNQQHGRYTVTQTCTDGGEGEGQRVEQKQALVVINSQRFAQEIGSMNTHYDYCAVAFLPPDLQGIARQADAMKP